MSFTEKVLYRLFHFAGSTVYCVLCTVHCTVYCVLCQRVA